MPPGVARRALGPSQSPFSGLSRTLVFTLTCLALLSTAVHGVQGAITHRASGCTFDLTMQKTSFCVNATVDAGVGEVTYELTTMVHAPEDVGWLALGFGQNMIRTQLILLWQNDDDHSMTVSHRYARYYTEPSILADPPRIASTVDVATLADNWQKPKEHTTYAFKIPARQRLLNGTLLSENLIWAYSPIRPQKNHTSHIARHFEIGHLKMEFEEVAQTPSPNRPDLPNDSSEKDGTIVQKPQPGTSVGHGHDEGEDEHDHDHASHGTTVHAHAFLLSFGLLFLLPFGVLAGRWGRTISPVWFKVHWIRNMAVAAPVIVLGWVLGPVAVWKHGAGHLDDAHKICGFIVLGLYGGQVLLGRYIHQKRADKLASGAAITNHHPPLNIGHVVFGLLFIALAFFQVRSGLDKLQSEPGEKAFVKWYRRVWGVWVVVLPLLYLAGLTLLPRQFRQERAGGLDSHNARLPADGEGSYVQLDDRDRDGGRETEEASSSTRLLFEVGRDEEGDEEEETEERETKKGSHGKV